MVTRLQRPVYADRMPSRDATFGAAPDRRLRARLKDASSLTTPTPGGRRRIHTHPGRCRQRSLMPRCVDNADSVSPELGGLYGRLVMQWLRLIVTESAGRLCPALQRRCDRA